MKEADMKKTLQKKRKIYNPLKIGIQLKDFG